MSSSFGMPFKLSKRSAKPSSPERHQDGCPLTSGVPRPASYSIRCSSLSSTGGAGRSLNLLYYY